jgi:hypothetical protein
MKILGIELKTRKSKSIMGRKEGLEYFCGDENLQLVIEKIRALASDKVDKTAFDEGTCVLGAGIKFMFLRARAQYPHSIFLFRAPFQGNVGSYKALKPVLDYVNKEFPEFKFYWEDGNMD